MTPSELDIQISLPGDWLAIDSEVFADQTTVDELVGERLDAVPELAPYRDDLVASVSRSMARAKEGGIIFTAVLAELTPEGQARTANLAIAVTELPAVADEDVEAGLTAGATSPMEQLERTLAEQPSEEQISHRTLDSILLPSGPAVRIARLYDIPLSDNGPLLSVLSVQYFLEAPEGAGMVVLNFTTPSLGEIDYLQSLFHEIARSFEMTL